MRSNIFTKKHVPTLLAGAAFGGLLASGIAYAAIPAADGTVNACYAKTGNVTELKGAVRVVEQGELCKSNEVAISWNQKGVKGDTGATGATGPSGTAGIDIINKSGVPVTIGAGEYTNGAAYCDPGQRAISGSYGFVGANAATIGDLAQVSVTRSSPASSRQGDEGWAVFVANASSKDVQVTVYVQCMVL